jgi:hypothetical protein
MDGDSDRSKGGPWRARDWAFNEPGDPDLPSEEGEDAVSELDERPPGNHSGHSPWTALERTMHSFGFEPTCTGCPRAKSVCGLRLYALHFSLGNGDASASTHLAKQIYPWLLDRLQKKFPWVDFDLIWDAMTDAFMKYVSNPQMLDASRGVPLSWYLAKTAARNVSNGLRKTGRRRGREELAWENLFEDVALWSSAEHLYIDGRILDKQLLDELVRGLEDPIERQFAEARLGGEKRTAPLARVLGVESLPQSAQRKAVKRMNDRIRSKLRRRVAQFRGSERA